MTDWSTIQPINQQSDLPTDQQTDMRVHSGSFTSNNKLNLPPRWTLGPRTSWSSGTSSRSGARSSSRARTTWPSSSSSSQRNPPSGCFEIRACFHMRQHLYDRPQHSQTRPVSHVASPQMGRHWFRHTPNIVTLSASAYFVPVFLNIMCILIWAAEKSQS